MRHKKPIAESEYQDVDVHITRPIPGIRELIMLGFDECHTAKRLSSHAHPGAMEIFYIANGSVRWQVGEEQYDISGGHVFCTWPDEMHGGIDDVWHPSEQYWLLLDLPKRMPAGYLGVPADEARALHNSLWHLPRRKFAASPRIAEIIGELIDAHRATDRLVTLRARTLLLQMLVEVVQFSHRPDETSGYSPVVATAIDLMTSRIEEPYSVPELAEMVGQSVSHFHRRFKGETGLAPGDYYVRHRVSVAARMIAETDLPLSKIAVQCGFGSSQYLATCFRRVTGRTPSSYRRRSRAG